MALVVEDGSVVPNADSYISVVDADAYFASRLYADAWNAADADTKEKALKTATFWLDVKVRWRGDKADEASALQWPRKNVCNNFGGKLPDEEMPKFLLAATAELAKSFLESDRLAESDTGGFKHIRIDTISLDMTSRASNGAGKSTLPRTVIDIITPYGRVGNDGRTAILRRS